MSPATLTPDTRAGGTVRAFAPRNDRTHWTCRGRVMTPATRPRSRYTGATVQCAAKLDPEWRWCPRCGGLIAWDGTAMYNGVELAHLERMPADENRA